MTEIKDIKELIEFSELWWGSAQEGEPIAEDEILLVKDLIASLKSQELEIKRLSNCQDCGGTGTNELCHDPYYVVPCACTVDWMSEAMEKSGQLSTQKAENASLITTIESQKEEIEQLRDVCESLYQLTQRGELTSFDLKEADRVYLSYIGSRTP